VERIKQAIEKVARQSRRDGKGATISQLSAHSDGLEQINYTYTRVVDLQMEHLENHRIVAINKDDPRSVVFDLLRTQVLQKMDENGWRTLAITSPVPESGKSMIAVNLAISIAKQTDKTAMLVDFDLRRPKVASYMGISMEKSLNSLLDGTAEMQEVLVNPNIPRLVVLAPMKPVNRPAETLSSKKVSNLIKELRDRYKSRIVIFDLPPLLVTDDPIALFPQIDCVLMVVPNGMCTRSEIEESLRYLSSANVIGTVLNKAEIDPIANYYYSSREE
jgi:protein-tyrosine kinase